MYKKIKTCILNPCLENAINVISLFSICLLLIIINTEASYSQGTMPQLKEVTYVQNVETPMSFDETIDGISFKMIFAKGGTFEMGSKTGTYFEILTFEASVKDFFIGETEVTQALWNAVMKESQHDRLEDCDSIFTKDCTGDNFPKFCISWYEAKQFIEKLNQLTGKKYRLPTETEWEYAAGGGASTDKHKRTNWPGFESEEQIEEYVWYTQNSNNRVNKVACLKPNYLGLYDMGGNLFEWCEDDFHFRYLGNPTDGQAWIDYPRGDNRIIRGGSWNFLANSTTISYRYYSGPTHYDNFTGFRLVLDRE